MNVKAKSVMMLILVVLLLGCVLLVCIGSVFNQGPVSQIPINDRTLSTRCYPLSGVGMWVSNSGNAAVAVRMTESEFAQQCLEEPNERRNQ